MLVSFFVIRHAGARAQPNERMMTITSTPVCVHNWNILGVVLPSNIRLNKGSVIVGETAA